MQCPKCGHIFSVPTKPMFTGPYATREEFENEVWRYWNHENKSQNWIALHFSVSNSVISRIIRSRRGTT